MPETMDAPADTDTTDGGGSTSPLTEEHHDLGVGIHWYRHASRICVRPRK